MKDLKLNVDIPEQEENGPSSILLTLDIVHDTRSTAASDDMSRTINYASIAKTISDAFSASSTAPSIHAVAHTSVSSCLDRHPEVGELLVRARTTLPSGTTAGVEVMTTRRHSRHMAWTSRLDGLQSQAIIGVNPDERTIPQPVVLDVVLEHSPEVHLKGARSLRELEHVLAKVIQCRADPVQPSTD